MPNLVSFSNKYWLISCPQYVLKIVPWVEPSKLVVVAAVVSADVVVTVGTVLELVLVVDEVLVEVPVISSASLSNRNKIIF